MFVYFFKETSDQLRRNVFSGANVVVNLSPNTVITCLSDAAGQRRNMLQPFGLALSTA